MAERIQKISKARALFDIQVTRLYQARLLLSTVEGGGAMSPNQRVIQEAMEIVSEITDENIRLAVSVKIDRAYGVANDNGWQVKYPR